MRVDCALLCDHVTVREGLLHILGGGVTRITRGEYPAPLGVALALRVMVHPTEADAEHKMEARLLAEDGEEVGRVEIQFQVGRDEESEAPSRPGEELSAAFPLPFQQVVINAPGAYSFELLIDGIHQASVPFLALRGGP